MRAMGLGVMVVATLFLVGCILPDSDRGFLTINKSSLTLVVGTKGLLTATTDSTGTVTWVSDNPLVVSVASDGSLKAGDAGVATVTAHVIASTGSATASCSVTVTPLFAGRVDDDPVNTNGWKDWPGYWMGQTFHPVETYPVNNTRTHIYSPAVLVDGVVYSVGYNSTGIPFYWEGSTRHDLFDPEGTRKGTAYAITVVDGDVYVAGSYEDTVPTYTYGPCYWVNGEFKPIDTSNVPFAFIALAITVVDGHVLTVGRENGSGEQPSFTAIDQVAVAGDFPLVTATYDGADLYRADNTGWYGPDGVRHALETVDNRSIQVYGITVADGVVYVAGDIAPAADTVFRRPVYWEGTTPHLMGEAWGDWGVATTILVGSNTLYIGGGSNAPENPSHRVCYWEVTSDSLVRHMLPGPTNTHDTLGDLGLGGLILGPVPYGYY